MAGVIQGKNCIIKFNLLGTYFPAVCAKSFTLTTTTDTVETTTQSDGQWKNYDYDALSYTISLEDVVKAIDAAGVTNYELLTAQTQFIEVDFQIFYADDDGYTIIITGTVIITSTDINAVASQVLSDNIEFQGKGAFTLQRILNPTTLTIIIQGETGATVLFKLINSEPATVFQETGLFLGTNKTYFIPKGMYAIYSEIQTLADDNNLSIDTPAAVNVDFDGDETINLPSLRDFNAPRTATYTIGTIPPPPCTDVTIVGTPALPDGATGVPYDYSFSIAGTAPFSMAINSKPSWMSIVISGSTVIFSGTPSVAGTDIEVDIDITNCSTGITNFTDTFDVEEEEFAAIFYDFTEETPSGGFIIRRNGNEWINITATESDSFAIEGGELIEARVSGTFGLTKYLKVEDLTASTILYEFSQTTGVNIYSFTSIDNHHYQITATVS